MENFDFTGYSAPGYYRYDEENKRHMHNPLEFREYVNFKDDQDPLSTQMLESLVRNTKFKVFTNKDELFETVQKYRRMLSEKRGVPEPDRE